MKNSKKISDEPFVGTQNLIEKGYWNIVFRYKANIKYFLTELDRGFYVGWNCIEY